MGRGDAGTVTKPTPAGLIRRNFHGAVLCTEYMQLPGGGNARGLVGNVQVLSAVEALGFDVNDRDSNWCVRVNGPLGSVTIPGCKVYAVLDFPADQPITNGDYWRVP